MRLTAAKCTNEAMTSALTLWLSEFCQLSLRHWSCWDFPSRCCWRLLCYRICNTSGGTLDWSNTGWAPPSGKTPSGLRDNAALKKDGAEIECPAAIFARNLENQFDEKRRSVYNKLQRIIKKVCFTGRYVWGWEIRVGPGQPLNDGVPLVTCRGRQKSPTCRPQPPEYEQLGHCIPLQDGAWQLRVVIGRGSVQFWTETSGLEHMTWRSWVPFPQETEHCKYQQVNSVNVKINTLRLHSSPSWGCIPGRGK